MLREFLVRGNRVQNLKKFIQRFFLALRNLGLMTMLLRLLLITWSGKVLAPIGVLEFPREPVK